MSKLTTEAVAKALAGALDQDNTNIFSSINVVDTAAGSVIAAKQEEDGITVFITVDEQQIRTVSYLFKMDDIQEDQRLTIAKQLLIESLSLPLVSFGIETDGQEENVVIFGSMSASSGIDELIEEVETVFATSELVANDIESIVKV